MSGIESTARAARGLAVSALVTMGVLTMLGPFGTDNFLPALPQMAEDLGAANGQTQYSLSGITLGTALGQIFAGPLSDGIGRRRPLLRRECLDGRCGRRRLDGAESRRARGLVRCDGARRVVRHGAQPRCHLGPRRRAFAYSISFGVNGVGLILAGIFTARLSGRMNSHDVIAIGLGMEGVAALVVLATALAGVVSGWTLLPALFLIASSKGFIFGPATSVALDGLRHVAGTALAVLGAVQFLFAGIVSPLVEVNGPRDPVPFAAVIAVGSALAWTCWVVFCPSARAAGAAQ